jgi:hypothetical protein
VEVTTTTRPLRIDRISFSTYDRIRARI